MSWYWVPVVFLFIGLAIALPIAFTSSSSSGGGGNGGTTPSPSTTPDVPPVPYSDTINYKETLPTYPTDSVSVSYGVTFVEPPTVSSITSTFTQSGQVCTPTINTAALDQVTLDVTCPTDFGYATLTSLDLRTQSSMVVIADQPVYHTGSNYYYSTQTDGSSGWNLVQPFGANTNVGSLIVINNRPSFAVAPTGGNVQYLQGNDITFAGTTISSSIISVVVTQISMAYNATTDILGVAYIDNTADVLFQGSADEGANWTVGTSIFTTGLESTYPVVLYYNQGNLPKVVFGDAGELKVYSNPNVDGSGVWALGDTIGDIVGYLPGPATTGLRMRVLRLTAATDYRLLAPVQSTFGIYRICFWDSTDGGNTFGTKVEITDVSFSNNVRRFDAVYAAGKTHVVLIDGADTGPMYVVTIEDNQSYTIEKVAQNSFNGNNECLIQAFSGDQLGIAFNLVNGEPNRFARSIEPGGAYNNDIQGSFDVDGLVPG